MEPSSREACAESVAERCRIVARRWGLAIGERFRVGSLSQVFACTTRDGTQAVLKFCPPDAPAALEAAALRFWNGQGAASLLDYDPLAGALLIELISPGTPLPSGDDPGTLAAAAGLLERLHSSSIPAGHPFPSFAEHYDGYLVRARAEADPIAAGTALLEHTRGPAMWLDATATQTTILHGDFIDKNLLLGPSGYVAIDPMPCVGDPCSDIGMFASYHPPARNIGTCARTLAGLLGHDPDRAERWALIWAIGEASETWREDSDELQEWVRSRSESLKDQ